MARKKLVEKTWTSENGKTKVVARRIDWGGEHKMLITITHNYGNYQFNGETRNNTGDERLYSKSDDLAYGIKRGIEYWRRHF